MPNTNFIAGTMLLAILATPICQWMVAAADEVKVPDLLKLSTFEEFKALPYLRAAEALQAAGKDKAFELLRELATKDDDWPHTRTVVLCRMLFKAKEGSEFRRARMGGPTLISGTEIRDWPLEPIAVVEGVPFLLARAYLLAGTSEKPSDYVEYCVQNCDWNDFKFKPVSKSELREALNTLLSSPPLRGRVNHFVVRFLEAQIGE
jgi:hypothetical protein